jgi:hypothetical protein
MQRWKASRYVCRIITDPGPDIVPIPLTDESRLSPMAKSRLLPAHMKNIADEMRRGEIIAQRR